MTIEYSVLELFNPFVLGYCDCGCGSNLKNLFNKQGKVIHYVQYHNIDKLRFYGEDHHKFNGYKTVHERGYVKLFMPDYPSSNKYGYVYQHRYVMEQHLGRFLKKGEVVHHVNGITNDNRIENLELIESNSKHMSENHRKDTSDRFCSECKSTTTYFRKSENMYIWATDDKGGWLCRSCKRKRQWAEGTPW